MTLDIPTFTTQLDDAVATSLASGWRDRIERVMTDGYSEVLALETTRRRARTRLQEVLQALPEDPGAVRDASRLSEEINELTQQIRVLRELLENAARAMHAA